MMLEVMCLLDRSTIVSNSNGGSNQSTCLNRP